MAESPEVSVVIPLYNGARFLERAVESVQRQQVSWELVIVDDASTDSSYEMAQRLAQRDLRIRALQRPHGGVAHARNAGYEATDPRSEFVVFLDQDDYWEPDSLAVLLAELRANPHCSAAYGLARQVDAAGNPLTRDETEALGYERFRLTGGRRPPLAPDEPTTFDVLVSWPCFCTPGQMLIRRKSLEAAGLFDPAVSGGDEWELAMRLSLVSPLAYVSRFVINKCEHDENATRIPGYVERSGRAIRTKLATHPIYNPHRDTVWEGHRESMRLNGRWLRESLARGDWRSAAHLAIRMTRNRAFYTRLRLSAHGGRYAGGERGNL